MFQFICIIYCVIASIHLINGSDSPVIQPELYLLELSFDLNEWNYNFRETILLNVTNSTSVIDIHSIGTDVDWMNTSLKCGNQLIEIDQFSVHEHQQMVRVHFSEEIPVDRCRWTLTGSNNINDTDAFFVDPKKQILTTKISVNSTRKIFPCFDEPHFKPKIILNVLHNSDFDVISNMPTEYSKTIGNLTNTQFEASKAMSMNSFALALLSNAYRSYEDEMIQIWVPNSDDRYIWSLDYIQDALKLFEHWIDNEYSLPKLYFISVDDLPALTFNSYSLFRVREPYLLQNDQDPMLMPIDMHQTSARIIASGITSTWFLHQVTPANEESRLIFDGLNVYLQYSLTSMTHSGWRYLEQMDVDLQKSLSECSWTFEKSEQCHILKVTSTIMLLETTIGADIFQKSLQLFIRKYSYSSANSSDLFDCFQHELDTSSRKWPAPVEQIFSSWLLHADDILRITRSINGTKLIIESTNDIVQYIAVSVITNGVNSINKSWLQSGTDISLDTSNNEWILFNKDASNVYRINYDINNWKRLTEALNHPEIMDTSLRSQLIDDAFNLARTGDLEFKYFFDLLKYLENETDFIPWTTAKYTINHLERILRGNDVHEKFQHFIQKLTNKKYNEYSVLERKTLNHIDRLNRLNIVELACFNGLDVCIDEIATIITPILNRTEIIADELLGIVLCTASRYVLKMNVKVERTVNKYIMDAFAKNNRPVSQLLERMAFGFGCATDEKVIKKGLDMTTMRVPPVLKIEIRHHDRDVLFKAFATGSYAGTKASLIFFKRNYRYIQQRFHSVPDVLRSFGPYITTSELMDLLININETHGNVFSESSQEAMTKTVHQGNENIQWLQTHGKSVENWLNNFDRDDDSSESTAYNVEQSQAVTSSVSNLILIWAVIFIFFFFRI